MMVQTPQSMQGTPGGGGGGGGGDVGYHANPSSSNTPVHHSSAPSSLDSQTQTAALYGDGRDYSSPVSALDHLPSAWQHHLNQHSSHPFTPSPGGGSSGQQQQDRSFKSEPEHGGGGGGGGGGAGDFPHAAAAVRSEAVPVNDSDRVKLIPLFFNMAPGDKTSFVIARS